MNTSEELIQSSEKAAMDWLIYAAQRKAYNGIPHSRWLYIPEMFAWKMSYPETSAYLIENLIERNPLYPKLQHTLAVQTGVWLLEQQSTDGYFYSGLKKQKPSVFNTGIITAGLHLLDKCEANEIYRKSILKAFEWFLSQICKDGIWQKGLYVEGWFPVYYAFALWKYIETDQYYFNGTNQNLLIKSYIYLLHKAQKELYLNSSFYPNTPCLSHTLAYGLQGLLECAKLFNDSNTLQWIYLTLEAWNERTLVGQQFPAEFYSEKKWNDSYICTTGHAQFAALYYEAYHQLHAPWALETAEHLMQKLMSIQLKNNSQGIHGAFPASYPVWKTYFPFRIVNWTQKFFLDACWRRRMVSST